jgi:hypothetical protein
MLWAAKAEFVLGRMGCFREAADYIRADAACVPRL